MDQAAQKLIDRHNEQMRELIVRDIDALESKLDVRRQVAHKADQAMDKVKGTLGMNHADQGESWGSFLRHNAVPLAAVGLGGTLLARNLRHQVSHDDDQSQTTRLVSESSYVPYRERTVSDGGSGDPTLRDRADSARSAVSSQAASARETVSDAKDTAMEKVSEARDSVTEQASSAKDAVVERVPSRQEAGRMAHDHGQALGLAAFAAGAAISAFVPRTSAEKRRLAPMQDQMKDQASSLVDQGVEKAKEVADRASTAVDAGVDSAKEEFESSAEDEPPSGGTADLPDLTRPNRITGSRPGAASSGLQSGSDVGRRS